MKTDKIDYFNFNKHKIGKPTTLVPVEELEALRRELAKCKAQIEAMRCCRNCKYGYESTLMPPVCDECIATSDLKNRYPNWQPKGVKQ